MTQPFRLNLRAQLKLSALALPSVVMTSVLTLALGASPALALDFGKANPDLEPAVTAAPSVGEIESAQADAGEAVSAIEVEGSQRLEKETVLSYLTISIGDRVDEDKMNASLKALYATGLFADVQLAMQGGTLYVKIVENPIVNHVSFEDNDAISKEDLEKEVQLKPRLVYTLPKVQKDVQRILDVYRRSGRFAATVDPKVVQLEQNRVDVIFEINEGKRTGIRRISFVGNEHYEEDKLTAVINTEETAWWKFFSSSDYYDPDRVTYDRELLRKFYLNEGYVDFRVASSVAEMTPDRKDFFLTFAIDEGHRYKFGKIKIVSEIKGLEGESLRPQLLTSEGDYYSADKIEKTITKLTAVLGDMQYAFVDITPEPDKHNDARTVDLTFHIKPGQRVYIGKIDVSGNTRTLDKVVRREMQVAEGDPFSTSKIKKSEQNIKDLGYFEEATVTPSEGEQPDRSDLKVKLKEKSTGEISVGAGFSTTDGPLGDFSIRERNFLGKGQDVRLGTTISGTTKQFDLSFTEPYFLDRNFAAGVDAFHVRSDQQSQSGYDETNTGFTLRGGYPLSPNLRQVPSYTLREDEVSDVDSDASRFIREQEGRALTSMVGQELTYDRRDSKLEPTEGYVTKLKTDFAGVGGERHYVRGKLTATQYYSLSEQYILSVLGEVGVIRGLDEDVHIADRFFLGGDTLRGFEYAGVGPRDLTNGVKDSLGGNRYERATIEMSFPTPLPENLGFKAHVFTDAGVLTDCQENPLPDELFKNDDTIRASAGVGISWASPFGLVRLDVAQPYLKQAYDKVEHVHFSFGTKF